MICHLYRSNKKTVGNQKDCWIYSTVTTVHSPAIIRAIEKHNLGGVTKFSSEWVEKIKAELEKLNLSEYFELANLIGQ